MKKPGLLIIIAGPSGVGKGTVRKEVTKNKSLNLAFSVSLTTRRPRKGEKDGIDYYFVDEDVFKSAIKNHDLIEYNKYVNNYYGTSKSQVEHKRKLGKNVILEIDVNGTKNVLKQYKKEDILSFFIVPPTLKELERRIRLRSTESGKVIKARLNKAKEEMKLKNKFDYVILNDNAKRAANEVIKYIQKTIRLRG